MMLLTAKHSILFLFLAGLLIQSCHNKDIYSTEITSLDSLSGVLNLLKKESNAIDTIALEKAIYRYNLYKQFIQQNINDTILKHEADFLNRFYTSGKNLENFKFNREQFSYRLDVINSQLEKLKHDTKNKLISEENVILYSNNEKKETGLLFEVSQNQLKLFYTAMPDFKLSLRGVEELIRLRNNGQLPVIVKDTLSL